MEKSILATITPKGFRKDAGKDVTATASSRKKKTISNNRRNLKGISSISSATLTNTPTTSIYKPFAKNHNDKLQIMQKTEYYEDERGISDEDGNSSEEDIEYDEDVVRKLLARKIEQAPAAKVIVSDAMMREALSEINAKKSGTSTNVKSSTQSMVTVSSCREDGERNSTITVASSISVARADTTPRKSGKSAEHVKNHGGDGDVPKPNKKRNIPATAANEGNMNGESISSHFGGGGDGEGADSIGCPLEKILEFLQSVMTKDYKRALVLGKEVKKHEPNNELVQEYMNVLQKIVSKEKENEHSQGSDSDTNKSSSEEDPEYTDELTTSSETDSVSGEEDSENSTENSSVPSSAEDETEEVDEGDRNDELEVKGSEGNKIGENVLEESIENGMTTESVSRCTSCGCDDEHGEVQCENSDEHVCQQQRVGEGVVYDDKSS